jgi:hypothetical protein
MESTLPGQSGEKPYNIENMLDYTPEKYVNYMPFRLIPFRQISVTGYPPVAGNGEHVNIFRGFSSSENGIMQ